MSKTIFSFKLEAKGALENVHFFPEEENISIRLTTDQDQKIWTNENFELHVVNPFTYKLVVFGVTGTEWTAELKIKSDGKFIDFLNWEGETGDTRRNISERTHPIKNIP